MTASLILNLLLISHLIAFADEDGQPTDAIRAALDAPGRPEVDKQRDADRKPADVLAIAGIEPGMTVAELMAGSGWYAEILARIVGPEGKVYAQNNATSNRVYGERLAARLDRLADAGINNIERMTEELEDLDFPARSLDAVFLVQFYHDTYWMNVDRAAMNRTIFEALEPGGAFLVIDHTAEAGSGARDVKTLHRVDPEMVKQEILAAGFELERADLELLANPDDDLTTLVFDPPIRGKTDRFLYLFRKPADD